ncbi:TPA: peptide ABC transporter permease [Candidatus Acetothermia bacterium]|nr:peptide ABC transporter permease [Candidatus Acetothermia bacterium]
MRSLQLGGALVGLSLGIVLLGLAWVPAEPTALGPDRFAPPSLRHPLGSDWFGRDTLARVMVGGRVSWAVAVIAVAIGGAVGMVLGGVAGWTGGILGEALMRVPDFLLAFPAVLVALLLVTVLGPGIVGIALAVALFTVPFFARLVHASVLALREEEFMTAAHAIGASQGRILLRHVLPNLASPLLVQTTVSLGGAFLAEAALSYLGLGFPPPHPAWGRMLQEAQTSIGHSPWPAVFPGLILGLTVLGLNLLGDGLRDLADPVTRRVTVGRQP